MTAQPAPPRDPDRFLVVTDGQEIETKVKGSRFLARVLRAADEPEATSRLHAIRKRHHDATHHCWAFRLGVPGEVLERFDDDGEPSGTAGQPILGALLRADVLDALVVVTRYFGGTKLGTGGLVRAYGEAAREAVERVSLEPRWLEVTLAIGCGFDDVGVVETLLGKHARAVLSIERSFEPEPRLTVRVKRSQADPLSRAVVEATAGRAHVESA
jgi:uncharacterized YigZ family protein